MSIIINKKAKTEIHKDEPITWDLLQMKKILITGSKGLIGKKVFNYLKKKNKVYGIDKHNVNLSNENEVKTFFKKNNNFDYLINLHGANEQVVKKKKI